MDYSVEIIILNDVLYEVASIECSLVGYCANERRAANQYLNDIAFYHIHVGTLYGLTWSAICILY